MFEHFKFKREGERKADKEERKKGIIFSEEENLKRMEEEKNSDPETR